jgi:hypothetical protein
MIQPSASVSTGSVSQSWCVIIELFVTPFLAVTSTSDASLTFLEGGLVVLVSRPLSITRLG